MEYLLAVLSAQNQFVVGWSTLAMIVAGIAQGKNRSGLVSWFLLSLLAGPIALFFLLIIDPEKN